MRQSFLRRIFLAAVCVCAAPGFGADATKSSARVFAPADLRRPISIAVDAYGGIYAGDIGEDGKEPPAIWKFTPHGRAILLGGETAAQVKNPVGLALNRGGDMFVMDSASNHIHKIGMDGAIVPLVAPESAGLLKKPTDAVVGGDGSIYVANEDDKTILKVREGVATVYAGKSGAGGAADGPAAEARFARPRGVALDAAGNLYVTDEDNHNIRKITPDGAVTTLAGPAGKNAGQSGATDGPGPSARFNGPRCLAVGKEGAVYVGDTMNHTIRKITPDGVVTTFAGAAGQPGFADGPAAAARFNEPRGLALDAAGNLFVIDTQNHAVRQITPDGAVTTVAGKAPAAGK